MQFMGDELSDAEITKIVGAIPASKIEAAVTYFKKPYDLAVKLLKARASAFVNNAIEIGSEADFQQAVQTVHADMIGFLNAQGFASPDDFASSHPEDAKEVAKYIQVIQLKAERRYGKQATTAELEDPNSIYNRQGVAIFSLLGKSTKGYAATQAEKNYVAQPSTPVEKKIPVLAIAAAAAVAFIAMKG